MVDTILSQSLSFDRPCFAFNVPPGFVGDRGKGGGNDPWWFGSTDIRERPLWPLVGINC